ncbi:MAG: tetratricopeptide repeat protein [Planctomycetota bacterium]
MVASDSRLSRSRPRGGVAALLFLALAGPAFAQDLTGAELERAVERVRGGTEAPEVLIELAEASLAALAGEPDGEAERDVRLGLGMALQALERYADAAPELQRAAELARTTANDRKLAHALWLVAVGDYHLGRLDEAVAAAEEGLDAAESAPWDAAHWRLANILGLSHERRGDAEAAIRAFQRGEASASRVAKHDGDTEGLMTLLGNFGVASMNLGEHEQALEIFEHVLDLVRESGHRPGLPYAVANVGDVLIHLGRYEEARAHHEEALALRVEDGAEVELARSYHSLGSIDIELGEFEAGLARLELAREIRQRLGLAPDLAITLIAMSSAYAGLDRDDEAIDAVERGFDMADQMDLKGRRVALLEQLARVLKDQGEHERALAAVEEAAELAREQRSIETHMRLAEYRTQHAAAEREHELALQQLALDKRRGERNALLVGGVLLAIAAAAGWYAWASLRRAVRRIRRLEQERMRAEQLGSIGVLAGGIAHDFNNILTIILGNVSMLRGAIGDGDPSHAFLNAVGSGVQRGKRLSEQLLSLAEGGAFARELRAIAPLIQESATFTLSGSSSRATFRIDPELWHGEVDAGQLQQLISNVVLNAAQAMPEGGVVDVSAENVRLEEPAPHGLDAGPYVRFAIGDRGPGIAPDIRNRVFDPYFTTKERGSGLGLALAYAIAQRHAGSIELWPNPGGGTRVEVLIPAVPDALAPVRADAMKPCRGEGRVLVMDDELLLRDYYDGALSSLGYDCEVVPDGATAVRQARRALEEDRPFALAVLDLTIPGGMGGVETARKLHALDPDLRAIVASGYSTDRALEDPAAFGFTEVLRKPFTTAALSEAVARAMAGERSPERMGQR